MGQASLSRDASEAGDDPVRDVGVGVEEEDRGFREARSAFGKASEKLVLRDELVVKEGSSLAIDGEDDARLACREP